MDRLLGVLAATDDAILDKERAVLLALAQKANVTVVAAAANAIEAGLTEHGIAGLAEAGVRKSITAAEPGIEAELGSEEAAFLDQLDETLKNAASRLEAS